VLFRLSFIGIRHSFTYKSPISRQYSQVALEYGLYRILINRALPHIYTAVLIVSVTAYTNASEPKLVDCYLMKILS